MNRLLILATAALTVLGAFVPMSTPVKASTDIQRCQSSDGTFIYTDKACKVLGASAMPLPAELLGHIARDEAMSAPARDPGIVDASLPLEGAAPVGRRSPASGCARSPTRLAMDLRGSLALGDVNRVAESYHWVGMSNKAGARTLDRLQQLTGRKVMESEYYGTQAGSSFPSELADDGTLLASADADGSGGLLQVVFSDDAARSVVDFDVREYAGCYFVSF